MGNGIDQYTNNPELNAASSAVDAANNTAAQYQSAAAMLPAALKDAINQKLDFNKTLIEDKNKSMVDYFNAPSQARVDFQDIFNPFQREALVQQSTNNAYLPYKNNQDILSARLGSITDIINSATGAFGAQVTSAQGSAQSAQAKLAYLLQLAGAKSDVAYKNKQLALSGSGGSDLSGISSLLGLLGANTNTTTPVESAGLPTEPQPINKAPSNPNVKWRSPQGQWEWNVSYQAWVPTGSDVTQ